MPQSGASAAQSARPCFEMGTSARALADGAVMFMYDVMFGFFSPVIKLIPFSSLVQQKKVYAPCVIEAFNSRCDQTTDVIHVHTH